ncbi:MAG TPA: hypothetical protein VFW44_04470 [Bryobacteraceae bacterium]|nr:hypothetical protein [Bryobacteraceae bacterium]
MSPEQSHPSDQHLLMAADGELHPADAARVASHLAACWACRVRKQKIEATIAKIIHFQQDADLQIPSADGPRALLKAQLAARARREASRFPVLGWGVAAVVAIAGIALFAVWNPSNRNTTQITAVTVPNPALTPGATVLIDQREVCMEAGTSNKAVPATLRKRVFAEYGIASAEPRAYEVDYLITPALGGADDIRNLWPQSNSSAVWNAEVKDMLEDHLRELVCDGRLDLATAQREIAVNWIEAYKKYFHTDRPLGSDRRAN